MTPIVAVRWLRRRPGRPVGSRDKNGRAVRVDSRARQMAAVRAFTLAVGLRIRLLREERDIAVTELAAAIDCSPAAICGWERGKSMPTLATMMMVAAAMQCSVVDLMPDEAHHPIEAIRGAA